MDVSNAFSSISRSAFLHNIRIICPALAIFIRDRFRATATSKIERFVIIVNGWKSLSIIKKHAILEAAAALDPPLVITVIMLILDYLLVVGVEFSQWKGQYKILLQQWQYTQSPLYLRTYASRRS